MINKAVTKFGKIATFVRPSQMWLNTELMLFWPSHSVLERQKW